jgi:hypothetical protein
MPVHRGGTLKIEAPWRIWQGNLTGNLTDPVIRSLTPATCWDVLGSGTDWPDSGRTTSRSSASHCASMSKVCQFGRHLS